MNRRATKWVVFGVAFAIGVRLSLAAAEEPRQVRGADELYWVPTLEQGLEMAQTTGRPLFLMGYSLVPNGTTYTKISSDYCTGVF
jgi:hypothetical protein